MALLSSFTNWLRGLVAPARTTSQMLSDLESNDLIGTERRRGQPAAISSPQLVHDIDPHRPPRGRQA